VKPEAITPPSTASETKEQPGPPAPASAEGKG
jgi:hypothetical protein